jgi:hypothetical protein
VPITPDGAARLADALRVADVRTPPGMVWVFDPVALVERRGTLYGWRDGAPRRGLVVMLERGPADRVEWVCEPFVRPRSE